MPMHFPAPTDEPEEARLSLLERENRWLKRYLGETLSELYALQNRMPSGSAS